MSVNIYCEETGTARGYEYYHQDIFVDGENVGGCDYDKKQGLFIGRIEYKGTKSKFIYHPDPEGICRKLRQWIEKMEGK